MKPGVAGSRMPVSGPSLTGQGNSRATHPTPTDAKPSSCSASGWVRGDRLNIGGLQTRTRRTAIVRCRSNAGRSAPVRPRAVARQARMPAGSRCPPRSATAPCTVPSCTVSAGLEGLHQRGEEPRRELPPGRCGGVPPPLQAAWGREGQELRVAGVDRAARTVNLEDADGRALTWEPNRVAAGMGGVEVYRVEDIELRADDHIRWTRNDAGLGLVNSQAAEVVAVEGGKVTFRLEDGRMLDLNAGDSQLRHVDRAWASTVHAFQGRTVDTVIAAMEVSHPQLTTQKSFYVEISRARDRSGLVTDDKAALKEQLESITCEWIAALEAIEPDKAKGRKAGLEAGQSTGKASEASTSARAGQVAGVGHGAFPHAEERRSWSRAAMGVTELVGSPCLHATIERV